MYQEEAEAYIQDISKPLKDAMQEFHALDGRKGLHPYKAIERRVRVAIAIRFGVNPDNQAITDADLRMLATEYASLGFDRRAPRPWTLPLIAYPMRITNYPCI